jgi:hypothetical protein
MKNKRIHARFTFSNAASSNLQGSRSEVGKRLPMRWKLSLIIGSIVMLLSTAPGWCQASTPSSQKEGATLIEKQNKGTAITEKWGIEILGIRQSAAGHMLDFRYRVVDSEKAAPLFARQTKPYLIDQASGKVLAVPNMAKVGPLRSSNPPQAGRTYWMFFGNPGLVKAGSKVSVVIGDFKVEDLTVQ